MHSTQLPPPSYLTEYVRYFWTLESTGSDPAPKTFNPVADGCPGVIFQLSDTGTFYRHTQSLPALFLYGQTTQPTKIQSTGTLRAIGICFHPTALKSVFGLNADELTNSCTDLNLLTKKQGFSLSDQLVNASSVAEQIEIISVYLVKLIRKNEAPADKCTHYALSRIIQSGGSLSLKDLQTELRLSERSFERKFKQNVGISPKLFSRICRFQASLAQLRSNTYDKLSDIAFDQAYADQSHFIRAFKEFAGFSPYQFQKQSKERVENFMEVVK